jgi:hypothetical protein
VLARINYVSELGYVCFELSLVYGEEDQCMTPLSPNVILSMNFVLKIFCNFCTGKDCLIKYEFAISLRKVLPSSKEDIILSPLIMVIKYCMK